MLQCYCTLHVSMRRHDLDFLIQRRGDLWQRDLGGVVQRLSLCGGEEVRRASRGLRSQRPHLRGRQLRRVLPGHAQVGSGSPAQGTDEFQRQEKREKV